MTLHLQPRFETEDWGNSFAELDFVDFQKKKKYKRLIKK